MALFRTEPPAVEPVSLAEAKAHLRLTEDDEDQMVGALVGAARRFLEADCGLALVSQRWRLTLDRWPSGEVTAIDLHPVVAIDAVTVYGADGGATLVDRARHTLDRASRPARLFLPRPRPLPRPFNGIEIDLTAGYGGPAEVPEPLRLAVLVLAAHSFEFRAGFGPEAQPVDIPQAYRRLVAPFRAVRLR